MAKHIRGRVGSCQSFWNAIPLGHTVKLLSFLFLPCVLSSSPSSSSSFPLLLLRSSLSSRWQPWQKRWTPSWKHFLSEGIATHSPHHLTPNTHTHTHMLSSRSLSTGFLCPLKTDISLWPAFSSLCFSLFSLCLLFTSIYTVYLWMSCQISQLDPYTQNFPQRTAADPRSVGAVRSAAALGDFFCQYEPRSSLTVTLFFWTYHPSATDEMFTWCQVKIFVPKWAKKKEKNWCKKLRKWSPAQLKHATVRLQLTVIFPVNRSV